VIRRHGRIQRKVDVELRLDGLLAHHGRALDLCYPPGQSPAPFSHPLPSSATASTRGLDFAHEGRPVRTIAYIYCVGSRGEEHPYCSRFCGSAAVHSALLAADRGEEIRQYHLYRDLRTYGKDEAMLTESRRRGSLYLKFADDQPPSVSRDGDGLRVTVRDLLTAGEEVTVAADLVVLVTGMVARKNPELIGTLKLPIGRGGFFNEIHPKLRPVETVVDGLLIAGTCQAPKTVAVSVASGLAAVTQAAAVLKRGVAELDPQVAVVNASACTGCGVCVDACPFGAITLVAADGTGAETGTARVAGARTAVIDVAGCKGCGGCAPSAPSTPSTCAGTPTRRCGR
jgi:heterodisulfide reductase subunit A